MLVALSVQAFAQSTQTAVNPGVVVEKAEKGLGAGKVGILDGDVLLNWSRGEAKRKITSPFDLAEIEIEQRPRGDATLEGLRLKEHRVWKPTPASWGMRVHLVLVTRFQFGAPP
jgi:hypothetical protein